MKVVFLDFDGVLNTTSFIDLSEDLYSARQLEPRAVLLLNQLVKRGEANVVITSSWRRVHPLEVMVALLRERGFEGNVIGATPSLHISPDGEPRVRGDEIRSWLDTQPFPVSRFVILDDCEDMSVVRHRLIQTNPEVGLQENDVERALRLLLD